jgi:hypothetical protein
MAWQSDTELDPRITSTFFNPSNRMLKKSASFVLSRASPCDVPRGYASVAELPAALLNGLFEHPAGVFSRWATHTGHRKSYIKNSFQSAYWIE